MESVETSTLATTDTTSSTPPPAETTAPQSPAQSISEHAAAFDPDRPSEDGDNDRPAHHSTTQRRNGEGQWRGGRHRAKSQQAGAGDVGRIGELTKKWRTEETARKALEEKQAALEKELQALKAPKTSAPPPVPEPFAKPAPKFEEFTGDDPLPDYILAAGKYATEQTLAEREAAQAKTARETWEREQTERQRAEYQSLASAYRSRLDTFKASRPDFDAVVNQARGMTPLLERALMADDRGPEFVYTLASKPELLSEFLFLSDGRAVTEDTVAHLRRLLASRMPVVATGSTLPAQPTYVPPKPPNPVRTGPLKTAADAPPAEASSIAEHAKYFGTSR